MKKQLLNLTMLLLVLLMGGGSALAADTETVTIFSQDYQSATVTDWTSPNASAALSIKKDGDNKYTAFIGQSGQNNRNAYLWFGTNLKLSELTSYKVSLKFCVNKLSANDGKKNLSEWMIVGEKSSVTNNSGHNASSSYYLVLSQKEYGKSEYNIQVGATALDQTITLVVGKWYTITQEISETEVKTTINDGSADVFTNTNAAGFSTIGHLKGINITSGRYYGEQFVDDILVTKEVEAGNIDAPAYSVTNINGASRTIKVSSVTEGVTFLWSDSAPAENEDYATWTEVKDNSFNATSPTVYVVAKKGEKYSETTTVTTTAGTKEQMPKPVIARTGANTYTVSVADKVVDGLKITPTIHYTVGTGKEESSVASTISLNDVKADIKAWATGNGLDNSENAEYEYIEAAVTSELWSVNLNDYIRSDTKYGSFANIASQEAETIGEWENLYSFNGEKRLYLTNNKDGWLFRPANSTAAFKCQSSVEGFVINGLTSANIVEIKAANDKGGTVISSLENSELAYSYSDYNFFVAPQSSGAIKINFKTGTRIVAVSVYNIVDVLPLSTEYTYSTYTPSSDVNLANEDGVEFYAAKANGNKVVLTKVEGAVKAGTGLLVKNTEKVASVTLNTATDGQEVADNALVGVTADMTAAQLVADNAYILVDDNTFQKVGAGASDVLAKGKAYLKVDAAEAQARQIFITTPTAVNVVAEKAEQTENVIYNMQGMRVKNADASGLYIVNGKKYIKK